VRRITPVLVRLKDVELIEQMLHLFGEYAQDLVAQGVVARHVFFEMTKINHTIGPHIKLAPRLVHGEKVRCKCYKLIKILSALMNRVLTKKPPRLLAAGRRFNLIRLLTNGA
jgi:hypothetical protein